MTLDGHLLHPELLALIPFGNSLTTNLLNRRIDEALADDPANDPEVSVVVRVFNEAAKLEKVFEDIDKQQFGRSIEVVVVDNGSSDRSPEVAKHYGAELVTLPQSEFTYPKSLNLGVAAASNDVVFVTVAHVRLTSVHNLHAGARHFRKAGNVAGAYGVTLPNEGASRVERVGASTGMNQWLSRPARRTKRVSPGVLSATGAMISKPVWQELGGFDNRYQAGGEDTALGKSMLRNGYEIVQEPALTVHHSHGLGVRDSIKQGIHQLQILREPRQFNREKLLERRPDLRADGTDV
ncbi:MAG: glycosyltransferase [Mycobacterium sp.]|uniref:glycosyltransferase n=1 Tax=Mycobacterium sp. TaxID=1785 RepID=UPI001ED14A1D|nr:glycosyltransferase [Mycobacterium sp.]MBW0017757.1 glycosyltransferase [Mycobacterium sp.]